MLKMILLSGISLLILAGCSNKVPEAEEVKKWNKNAGLSINHNLLMGKDYIVPKEPYLKNGNWTYQVNATKEGQELFKNEQIVETFLVAHNSKTIVIIGRKDLIKEYKNYFLSNGVTALIKEQQVTPIKRDFNTVNILFFNQNS